MSCIPLTPEQIAYGICPNTHVFTPQQYGAVGDAQHIQTVALSGNTVTSPYPVFTPGDTGKVVYLSAHGAQPSSLRTLAYVSPTVAILSGDALHTHFNGGQLVFATQDDTTALKACFAAAMSASGPRKKAKIVIPAGGYLFSAAFMDLVTTGMQGWGPDVEGAGRRRTNFYVSPDYTWGSLGMGGAVVTSHSLTSGAYSGFSILGNFCNPGVGYKVLDFSLASRVELDNVEVSQFRGGCIAALYTTSKGSLRNCHIEGSTGYGIAVDQVDNFDIYSTYHGNGNNYPALQVYASHVRMFGGIQDESTQHNILVTGNATLSCFGAGIYGLAGAYAVKVQSGSRVNFFGCKAVPFGDHPNSGILDIDATSSAFATGSRLKGTGTRFAVLNAGTFHDGGGNTIEGTGISSTGTLRGVTGAAVADATDAPSVITQLNALLAELRTRGDISP